MYIYIVNVYMYIYIYILLLYIYGDPIYTVDIVYAHNREYISLSDLGVTARAM